MNRQAFLKTSLLGAGWLASGAPLLAGNSETQSGMKITRIRLYRPPNLNPTFNQSNYIVTIETDAGITGIGEGGSPDTIRQLGGLLIGEDPFRIEHLWQLMYRAYFYPPGREKIHAQGAMDLALWDIKGKALRTPVYELLGGLTRDHIECYSTAFPSQGSRRDTARACIESGFRAFRFHGADFPAGQPYDAHKAVELTYEACREVDEGVGAGEWAIDFHTRLDFPQAVRLCGLIEPLAPLFVEDLIRSENKNQYRLVRSQVKVPVAVGEHFSDRWDIQQLIEEDLIDHCRITLPNSGGITELKKIAAMCETHYVGLVPHFTGPLATASLVHVLASSSGPVMMEILRDKPREEAHLPEWLDFRDGKVFPTDRHGLGVVFDPAQAEQVLEVTERSAPVPQLRRPDGSYTNW